MFLIRPPLLTATQRKWFNLIEVKTRINTSRLSKPICEGYNSDVKRYKFGWWGKETIGIKQ